MPPVSLVNRFSLPPFNALYYALGKARSGTRTSYYDNFYYPLDSIKNWNRIYGPKGFYQYQSVVPLDIAKSVTHAMLKEISKVGDGSFLAVLKNLEIERLRECLAFLNRGHTRAGFC